MRTATGILAALLGAAVLQPLTAQVRVPDNVQIRFSGRLHAQFNTTSVDTERSSDFLIRRARLSAEVNVGPWVTGKVEPDFGEGGIELKDAWVRLNLSPAFQVSAGQFKRPFDLFELTSSTQILVIERAGGVRGVSACAGPGGVCSFSRLTEKLQFADRDIGVLVEGERGNVFYAASVTNGTGANTPDENGNKSYTARLGVTAASGVVIAANAAMHDYVHPTTGLDRYAHAIGADVELGDFGGGPHAQLGFVTGENWSNPQDPQTGTTFVTAQAIVTYRAGLMRGPLHGIEPLFRVSYGDPDTDTADDQGWLLTPGVMLHLMGRNKVAFNADIWSPGTGSSEWSFKSQMYFYF